MRRNDEWRIANGESGRRAKALRTFRIRPTTLAASIVLGMLVLAATVTLPFSMRWYNVQSLDNAVRHPPAWAPVVSENRFVRTLSDDRTDPAPRGLPTSRDSISSAARFAYGFTSLFGHDDLGRSLLYRVLPGFLISLTIGLAAAAIAVVIGATWGAVAALFGGRIDQLMMRIVDVLYGLPYILMVILLKIALTAPLTLLFGGKSKYADVAVLFLAIGGVSWLTMARVVRGQVLSLKNEIFMEAARAAGAGPLYILFRHVFPNLIGTIITYAMLVVPQAILQESFLSFLGIGVQQPTPSLGRLAADGIEAVNMFVGYWWLIVIPCAVLVVTLLALNFVGDALRDAFDPKSTAATLV